MAKKAFVVIIEGFPPGIVAAETRAKAISVAYRSVRGCGYNVEWNKIRAVRQHSFDLWASTDKSGHAWDPGILAKIIEQNSIYAA